MPNGIIWIFLPPSDDDSNSPCAGFEDNPEASQAATAVVTSVERFGSEFAFFWFEYVEDDEDDDEDDDDDDDDDHDKMLPLMKSRLAELGGQRLDLTLFAPKIQAPNFGSFSSFFFRVSVLRKGQ